MNQDKDLAFLATCKNEDLRTLCDILTYNKNGELTISESILNNNTAEWGGGAIWKYSNQNLSFKDCTFKDNRPDDVFEKK